MTNYACRKEFARGLLCAIERVAPEIERFCATSIPEKKRHGWRKALIPVASATFASIAIGIPLGVILSKNNESSTPGLAFLDNDYSSFLEMETAYDRFYSVYFEQTGGQEAERPDFFRLNYEERLDSSVGAMAYFINGITWDYKDLCAEKIIPWEMGFSASLCLTLFNKNGQEETTVVPCFTLNYFRKVADVSSPSLEWEDPLRFDIITLSDLYLNFGNFALQPSRETLGGTDYICRFLVEKNTNQAIISVAYPTRAVLNQWSYEGIAEESHEKFESTMTNIMISIEKQTKIMLMEG